MSSDGVSLPQFLHELAGRGVKLWQDGDRLRIQAPPAALDDEAKQRLARDKHAILGWLRDAGRQLAHVTPAVAPRPADGRLPLSFSQEELWVADTLAPGSGGFKVGLALDCRGRLRRDALASSLAALLERHDALRARFPLSDGRAVQTIGEARPIDLAVADLTHLPEAERLAEAQRLDASELRRPFDLSSGPLMRATLVVLAAEHHLLLVTWHHIVCDAWSVVVFVRELATLYASAVAGRPAQLPGLPSYAEQVVGQRAVGERDDPQGMAYWRSRLGAGTAPLALPADRPPPAMPSFDVVSSALRIDDELGARLRRLGQLERCTPFMTLLGALDALLFRYSGERRIAVGAPTAGRFAPEARGLIGCFAYPLVLLTEVDGELSFRQLLRRVRETTLGAYEHQRVPFTKVAAIAAGRGRGRDSHRAPFQVMLTCPAPGSSLDLIQTLELGELSVTTVARDTPVPYDLLLSVFERGAGFEGLVSGLRDRFDAKSVERIRAHFLTLLRAIADDPERAIGELPIASAAERAELEALEMASGARAVTLAAACGGVGDAPRVHLVDPSLGPVPVGVVGEIALSGVRAAGALASREGARDPALPATATIDGAGVILTGDLARWTVDGRLERCGSKGSWTYLGDRRLSLAPIHAALLASGWVDDCAVRVRTPSSGVPELVAYVVSTRAGPEVLYPQLAAELAARLPQGDVPRSFVALSALPLTPAGDLDEGQLQGLPVIDAELLTGWERRVAELPGVRAVAVVPASASPETRVLHVSDLLPSSALTRDAIGAAASEPASRPPLAARPPAFADGGPLLVPEGAPATLTEALFAAARIDDERGIVCVDADGTQRPLPYRELLHRARCLLGGLRAAGLQPGGRVILQLSRLPDHFVSFWACILGGFVPVTVAIAPSYRERGAVVNKLANTWELLDAPYVVTDASLREAVAGLEDLCGLRGLRVLVVEELRGAVEAEVHPSRPDDVVFHQLTSGSTGVPKCIQETHRGILAHVFGSQQVLGYQASNVTLNWLPPDHVVPILTCHLKDVVLGCREVHVKTEHILNQPLAWLDLIEQHRVTHSWAPNFGFKLVADRLATARDRSWDLSSLEYLMNAGEQVTLPVMREFLRATAPFGVRERCMHPAFGMAETCTAMTYQTAYTDASGVHRVRKSSLGAALEFTDRDGPQTTTFVDLGAPIPGMAIRIADEHGQVLPEGQIGRVLIRGVSITPGYLHNDEANREAFVGDGWFDSGDLGFIHEGRLTLTGRAKEVIIVRGANFYCYEIEDVVNRVEGVEPTFVAACAVGDPAAGTEGLAVFYVPRGATGEPEPDVDQIRAIRAAVAKDLGLSPQCVLPLGKEHFPKTTSGKIQRTRLRKGLEDGTYDELRKRTDLALGGSGTLPGWFFTKEWRPLRIQPGQAADGAALIVGDAGGVGRALAQRLRAGGARAIEIELGPEPARLAEDRFRVDPRVAASWSHVLEAAGQVGSLVHIEDESPPAIDVMRDALTRAQAFVILLQALAARRAGDDPGVVQLVLARDTDTSAGERDRRAAVVGLLRTAAFELPWLRPRCVELPADIAGRNAERLLRELSDLSAEPEVTYRDDGRFVPRLRELELDPSLPPRASLQAGRLYVVTGGLGGVGALLARRLVAEHDVHLLLLGRSSAAARAADLDGLDRDRIAYEAVDVCEAAALDAAVARCEQRRGVRLGGAFHLAGAYRETMLVEESPAGLEAALRAKVLGSMSLAQVVRDRGAELFVAFSSLNGSFGGFGVGAYAGANRFLETFCAALRDEGLASYCLEWSLWREVGISRALDSATAAAARGYRPIAPEDGLISCLSMLRRPPGHYLIGLDPRRPAVRRLLAGASEPVQSLTAYYEGELGPVALEPRFDRFGAESRCDLVAMPALPRNGGRIDREQLSRGGPARRRGEHEDPRGEVEERLAGIWRTVLGVGRIGRQDDFFELGGHSLAATQVVARLGSELEVELQLSDLFAARTLARLAERVDTLRWAAQAQEPAAATGGGGARDEGEI